MFDSNGNFHISLRPQSETTSYSYDVAISDVHDTIYLLVTQLMSPRISSPEKLKVKVLNETLDFQLRFPVGKGSGFNRLTVSGSKVFILKEHKVVDLYHARNGSYVGSFSEGIIEEITASKDGRVMVLDSDQSCHLFNVDYILPTSVSTSKEIAITALRATQLVNRLKSLVKKERHTPDSSNIHCQWRL